MVGKKVVYYGPKDLRLEDMESVPVCGPGELVCEVEAAAICGSDIKAYNVGNPKMQPPCTPGHEFVGTLVAVGEGVEDFAVGERITMATTIGCGECIYCKEGRTNVCLNAKPMGFVYNGAMAKYVVIPAHAVKMGNVVKVGDLAKEVAAVAEPMSCVMNGLGRIPVQTFKSAVVIGLGALGMFHSISLREFGVENIVCCDFPGAKKDVMDSLGFHTVTPDELAENWKELSGGYGFDLVVVTAPANKVQATAPMYARKGGYVSFFASLPVGSEMVEINSRTIHYNELFVFGTSDSTPEHVRKALTILKARQDDIMKMITVLPISQYMEGYEGVMSMKYAKVVLIPE